MASSSYTDDLTCSICLSIFTDPVVIMCGHSFCRECITRSLSSASQCPQCRVTVPNEERFLMTNHILKSLAVKEAEKQREKRGAGEEVGDRLCPEHEEKLKLFCITDQQLACIICRDGERHEGHRFKPIKEAAASVRKELEALVQQVCGDIGAIESLADTQREEITKTREKAEQLKTQISRQFEEMQQFLRKRESEIQKDLKDKEDEAVEKMKETLDAMETALSENRELEEKVASVLKITDYENLLKSWTEENKMVDVKGSFQPRGGRLQVVSPSVCLGPHETHLQFFVWKEMLQVIQPRAEALSLSSNDRNITVSGDGRGLMYTPKIVQFNRSYVGFGSVISRKCQYCRRSAHSCPTYKEDTTVRYPSVSSSSQFTSGQHYWEIEVGGSSYWVVGVKTHYLTYDQSQLTSSSGTQLNIGTPQKVGVYLDCQSKELSFYDAENMTHIHTMKCSVPVAAHFQYKYSQGADHNPPQGELVLSPGSEWRREERRGNDHGHIAYSDRSV